MKENKKTYTLILVAFLTVSAYFLADTVDAVIGRSLEAAPTFTSPLEQRDRNGLEPRREMSDYSPILERGLFGDGKAPSGGGGAAAEATSYKLIGTVSGESFSGAVLEDSSGQAFYRIHQKLPDGSMIVKVMHDRITLKNAGGATIELSVVDDTKIIAIAKPGSGGFKKVSEGKWQVDQKEILSSTENMNQILTQARALPYTENGKTVGFRISEIVPGSIYEKIGLVNGDVIQRVNSQEVDDPSKFFQLYQGLRTEPNVVIDVIRGGQHQTMSYEVR